MENGSLKLWNEKRKKVFERERERERNKDREREKLGGKG